MRKAMTKPERSDLRLPYNFFTRRFHPDPSWRTHREHISFDPPSFCHVGSGVGILAGDLARWLRERSVIRHAHGRCGTACK